MPRAIWGQGIAEQAKIAVANLNAVLAEAGMNASNLAKVNIYLTDESVIPRLHGGGGRHAAFMKPGITLLVVKALAAPPLRVEIEAAAAA